MKLLLQSCDEPHFKLDNSDYILKTAKYNILLLSGVNSTERPAILTVRKSLSCNDDSDLIKILRKHPINSDLVAIIADPILTRRSTTIKKILNLQDVPRCFTERHWIYFGLKRNGHFEELEFRCDNELAEIKLDVDQLLHKLKAPNNKAHRLSSLKRLSHAPTAFPDHIFILNRYFEPGKKIAIHSIMEQLNLNYTVITADETELGKTDNNIKRSLLSVLDEAECNNYRNFLFLTDNCRLHVDFIKQVNAVFSVTPMWNLIYLINTHRLSNRSKQTLIPATKYQLPDWHSFIIHVDMYDQLRHLLKVDNNSLDDITRSLICDNDCFVSKNSAVVVDCSEYHRKNKQNYLVPKIPSVNIIVSATDKLTVKSCQKQDYPNFVINGTEDTDFIMKLEDHCYISTRCVSRLVDEMETNEIDYQCICPRTIYIDHRKEGNVLRKLRLNDQPAFRVHETKFNHKNCFIRTNTDSEEKLCHEFLEVYMQYH